LVLYRLYTEDEPGYRKSVVQALQRHGFLDFTLASGVGYGPGQGGKQENVVIIDVATNYTPATDKKIQVAAKDICRDNRQQSVLIVRIPAFPKLVAAPRRRDQTRTTLEFALMLAHEEPLYVSANGKPARKRAAYRGKVLASFGEWNRLLPNGAVVEGRIARFM
jgi:hypothetical protein